MTVPPSRQARPNSDTNLDHIFPQSFFRDTEFLQTSEYDRIWNLQRTHETCNNQEKGGFLNGFPVFHCECHWLQIRERNGTYALEVSYRPPNGNEYQRIIVPYGQFQVGREISDPKQLLPKGGEHKVVGFMQAPSRGMKISQVTVDVTRAFSGGRQSFTFVGKSKRGVIRQGENGHVFPVLAPDEVPAFNNAEKLRMRSGGTLDNNLLATLNSEVITMELRHHE